VTNQENKYFKKRGANIGKLLSPKPIWCYEEEKYFIISFQIKVFLLSLVRHEEPEEYSGSSTSTNQIIIKKVFFDQTLISGNDLKLQYFFK
jgi:hypothetical protein